MVFQMLTCIEKVWFRPDINSMVDWALKMTYLLFIDLLTQPREDQPADVNLPFSDMERSIFTLVF